MRQVIRRLRLFRSTAIALVALGLAPLVSSAVLVAPHAVFVDHQTRTAQITLANPSGEPEEVEIELQFGYPTTDSLGNPYVELVEQPGPDHPSASEWISAFPRRVRLEPGQRQVVRLLATPPAELPDGEHWSRLIVTSRRARGAVAGADSGLQVGLTFELRTIISVNYRKGQLYTNARLNGFQSYVEGDTLVVWVELEREGNAAYLGTLQLSIHDGNQRAVRTWSVPVAVYYDLNRRLALPLDSLPTGDYRVRMELTTVREDIPQSRVLQAPPITRSVEIGVR